MVTGIEGIAIVAAIAALISAFDASMKLVDRVKEFRQQRHDNRIILDLERLQQALELARATVQHKYEDEYRRCGQRFSLGDELAHFILFSLAERQKALVSELKICDPSAITNVDPIISDVDRTRQSATRCLENLAARSIRSEPQTPRLTFQERAALLREYQNLCPSAARYRDGLVSHSQLCTMSANKRELSCDECGARIVPHKTELPMGDATSWVMINMSGLLRSHCNVGGGWACIWQPQVPPCFGVFRDEKALLMHMIDAHIRDEGDDVGIQVDWPADHRRGDVDKCGFMVRVDGMVMRNVAGDLVVPRRIGWVASSGALDRHRPGIIRTSSTSTSASQWTGSDASSTMLGSLPEMQ